MKIVRSIEKELTARMFQGKVIILYGPRQVGKTTLMRTITDKYPSSLFLNCDESDTRAALTDTTSTQLQAFIGNPKVLVIDEAQRVHNIGLTLKLLVDHYPEIQVIATGSSSFELANQVVEPLTGRKFEFHLYPFAMSELQEPLGRQENMRLLERRMIYGLYPEIALTAGDNVVELLGEIARSYVYKDILAFHNLKHPEVLEKLLRALALQIGQEVSYNELATLTGVNKNTISTYIGLLEKAFIIFRLSPFSRNLRNELKKLRKIYFYDTGIRNALINNFNPLEFRQDTGALWENFLLAERLKRNSFLRHHYNTYFWRTHNQQEIDYLEEAHGTITGFEFKWKNPSKYTPPTAFTTAYPDSHVHLILRQNLEEFIM